MSLRRLSSPSSSVKRARMGDHWVAGPYDSTKNLLVCCRICHEDIVFKDVSLEGNAQYGDFCFQCEARRRGPPQIEKWMVQYMCVLCKKSVRLPTRFKYIAKSSYCPSHYQAGVEDGSVIVDGVQVKGSTVTDALKAELPGKNLSVIPLVDANSSQGSRSSGGSLMLMGK
jgi:hypothetical protein